MAQARLIVLAAFAPTVNVSNVCHGQEKGLPNNQRAPAYHACMQAEQASLAELRRSWTQFPTSAKQPCVSLTPTFQSYVETLVCIEIEPGQDLRR